MRTVTARLLPPVCLLLLVACAGTHSTVAPGEPPSASGPTVVLLVRHAEKVLEGEDPALTPAGKQRAEALVEVAGSAGVSALYTTQYLRTRETALPVAERLGIPVTVRGITPGALPAHVAELSREVLTQHRGGTVLVVGHSNTLPALVEALAGVPVQPIPDSEYDRLFVVVVPPSGPARLVQARYGVRTAP